MVMTITSPAFSHGGEMPVRFTAQGEDISPPLDFSGVPKDAKSLVLIVDDPDAPDPKAPQRVYVHWVLYDLPPSTTGLREGILRNDLPKGTEVGLNDWHKAEYGGPNPPIGRHRYFHKLYALDTVLPHIEGATKAKVEAAMRGHVLATAELVGTWEKGATSRRAS